MNSYLLVISIVFTQFIGLAQIPHEYPLYPKGDPGSQLLALPYYNQACDFYKNGAVSDAKKALNKAIQTDMALVEAQAFLADIFYAESNWDSAFFYYNTAIDFVVELPPHYYFRHFELGMKLGEYD